MGACASGAVVKPGVDPATNVPVDRSLWEQVTGTPSSWLDFILNIIQPSSIDVTTLCALNPDDPPLPTLADITGALQRNPFSLKILSDWAIAKITYSQFANYCVCNVASGPCYSIFGSPIPVLPDTAAFGGTPTYDLGMKFTAVGASDLGSFEYRGLFSSGSTNNNFKLWDLTAAALLWTQTVAVPDSADHIVACATVITLINGHDYAITYTAGNFWSAKVENAGWVDGTFGFLTTHSRIDNYSGGTIPSRGFSGLAVGVQPILCPSTAPPPDPIEPVQPPTLILPPDWSCATACDIMIRLQQISDRLDWLRRDVTLIQRQAVPFGYIVGTVHSGLTGTGSISVQAILGARVHLTTVPSYWGLSSDYPQRWIPAPAMIAPGTSIGDQDTHFVHFTDELWFPSDMGAMTHLAYEFKPGVTGSITELLREP